jgi:flagellar FliL protein
MATPPKNESAPAAAGATAAAAAAAAAPAAPAGKSMLGTLLPVVLVVVLAPVVSWVVMQFVMLPQLEKKLAAAGSGAVVASNSSAPAPAPAAEKGKGKKGEATAPSAPNAYQFENVIVNLSGTMGTRYLKTTFLVTGSDQKLNETFVLNKAQLVDITLNILSSLTLADTEEAGAKNIIREKLVNAYNQALGRKVAEQIYFSDFVVQ